MNAEILFTNVIPLTHVSILDFCENVVILTFHVLCTQIELCWCHV
jgi:hypothetical protein